MLDLRCTTRWFRALVAGFALWAIAPMSASAQDVGFVLLIENGWSSLLNRSFTDDRGMTYLGTGSHLVYSVVNGQKVPGQIASANIAAWTRDVPDPYFAPIRPLAGLIVLNFGGFQGHLAIIDTPTGLKTTIAILDVTGAVNLGASGAWVFSDGTTVSGGTANDLVVAGVVHFAPTWAFLGGPLVDLVPRFPTPPFAYDTTPLTTHAVGGTVEMGSFYAAAHDPFPGRPARSFTSVDSGLVGFGRWAQLLVIQLGVDSYFVIACDEASAPALTPTRCPVSGTGGSGGFARVTGSAFYQIAGISIKLATQIYLTP